MILDYLQEHANSSFEKLPLNVLDLLIISELAYFEYPSQVWGTALAHALEHAIHFTDPALNKGHQRIVDLSEAEDLQLAAIMQKARRYENIRLVSSTSSYDENNYQFSGASFMLDDILFLAFRGTDESSTGWKEALELSLETPGAGRLHSVQFFKEQAATSNGPIIACGHSKGGNFAVYSSLIAAADPHISDRIAAVMSFDGPGFSPSMRAKPEYLDIGMRTSAYIPKSSIIGNIHEYPEGAITYIESKKIFIAQHPIYSWETSDDCFVSCKQSLAGKLGSAALNLLIDNLNDHQKKMVINAAMKIPLLLARSR